MAWGGEITCRKAFTTLPDLVLPHLVAPSICGFELVQYLGKLARLNFHIFLRRLHPALEPGRVIRSCFNLNSVSHPTRGGCRFRQYEAPNVNPCIAAIAVKLRQYL
jgi:hypothetical protein